MNAWTVGGKWPLMRLVNQQRPSSLDVVVAGGSGLMVLHPCSAAAAAARQRADRAPCSLAAAYPDSPTGSVQNNLMDRHAHFYFFLNSFRH